MAQVGVVVDRQHGLGLDAVERQEAVVEAVLERPHHVHGHADLGPLEFGRRRPRRVPATWSNFGLES